MRFNGSKTPARWGCLIAVLDPIKMKKENDHTIVDAKDVIISDAPISDAPLMKKENELKNDEVCKECGHPLEHHHANNHSKIYRCNAVTKVKNGIIKKICKCKFRILRWIFLKIFFEKFLII